jgi:hypothetical protein
LIKNVESRVEPMVLNGGVGGSAMKIKAQEIGMSREEGGNGRTESRRQEAVGARRIEGSW